MKKTVTKQNKDRSENTKKSFVKSFGHHGFKSSKIKPTVTFRSQGRKK
tara:strand:- start:108 stop:251 length:144 start_codon:yes stop_codon:yes gene_type:complete